MILSSSLFKYEDRFCRSHGTYVIRMSRPDYEWLGTCRCKQAFASKYHPNQQMTSQLIILFKKTLLE
jgi:hypothetical protein